MRHTPPAAVHPVTSVLNLSKDERGMALVIALMSILLLSALGIGLVITTMSETMITSNYKESAEAMYAADAAVERVMQELLTVADWNRILQGAVRSSYVDGAPSGQRTLPGGGEINLTAATNMLNCGRSTPDCTDVDMAVKTEERPYGANNPRWRLYAYSPLTSIIETRTVASPMYVAVWLADDPAENDGDPLTDGTGGGNPGTGILLMRAEAFGPEGTVMIIETTLGRSDTTELERGYTGQRGQDEQNRRARKAPVQIAEKSLTRSDLDVTSTLGGFTVR